MIDNPTQPDIVALINEIIKLEERGESPIRIRELHIALHILLSPERFERLRTELMSIRAAHQAGLGQGRRVYP